MHRHDSKHEDHGGKPEHERKKARGRRFMAKERVAEYLRGLADNVENGEIFVEDENASIFLKPRDEVYLEVEAGEGKHGCSYELKISWSDKCSCGCSCSCSEEKDEP